ncbi:MAG TPA: hypothetical protein VLZ83_00135 [Edaphocola sp.]|nr:hypothetical protein [Edaphocola sp.]
MKKKVIFAVATGLFALATVFNMNVLQSNSAGDVSLESIATMAQAQNGESSSLSEKIYVVTKFCNETPKYITCYKGGDETCLINDHCPM